MNNHLYLHEEIITTPFHTGAYMVTGGGMQIGSRHELVGSFGAVRAAGRWPRALLLLETSWSAVSATLEHQGGIADRDTTAPPPPGRPEFDELAKSQRTGGLSRILQPGPESPDLAHIQTTKAFQAKRCIVELDVTVRDASLTEYLSWFHENCVPVASVEEWGAFMWLGCLQSPRALTYFVGPSWEGLRSLAKALPTPPSHVPGSDPYLALCAMGEKSIPEHVKTVGPSSLGASIADSKPVSRGRPYPIFFVCSIALFMFSMDLTIVATALPKIGTALHSRLNWLGWTITIYNLGQIIILPIAGRLSERLGSKRFFLICAIVFTAASVACGISTSIYMLVPLRLVQSIGGAGFLPSASGIVANQFGEDRDRALGMFTSIFPIGAIAGPIFGGLITQYWIWRGIFFVNLPVGVLLIFFIIRVIPSSPPRAAKLSDLRGIALLTITLVVGMLAITNAGEAHTSPTHWTVLAPGIAAIILGFFFTRHINRHEAPVVSPRFLASKPFGAVNLLNVLFGGAGIGFGFLVPLYAEKRYGIGVSGAGTVLAAQAIGMMVTATATAMLLRRVGYRRPMLIGLSGIALSLVFLGIGARGISPYWWLELFSALSGVALGIVAPAFNNATLALAPTEVTAIAGLRAMFRNIGTILVVSITTAVLARSDNPGLAQAHLFWAFAIALLVTCLIVFTVPDQRGKW